MKTPSRKPPKVRAIPAAEYLAKYASSAPKRNKRCAVCGIAERYPDVYRQMRSFWFDDDWGAKGVASYAVNCGIPNITRSMVDPHFRDNHEARTGWKP